MPKFTNISTGDRGLYTIDGLIMVPAGATTDDVKLADNEDLNEEWFAKAGSAAAKEAVSEPSKDAGAKE